MNLTKRFYQTIAKTIAIVSFLLALCLSTTNLLAANTMIKGWAWANQPATAAYACPSAYCYNSQNGAIWISRSSTGYYTINFDSLSTNGGVAHVTAYGGNHHCKVRGWYSAGSSLLLNVKCIGTDGIPVDGKFTALFYKETQKINRYTAYVRANQASSDLNIDYIPSLNYQWNSMDANNSVTRIGVGQYRVRVPKLGTWDGKSGTVMVTAYGDDRNFCKVRNWALDGTNVLVYVNCFSALGFAQNNGFTMSFMRDLTLAAPVGEHLKYNAYVWLDNEAGGFQAHSYQDNNKIPAPTPSWADVTFLGPGTYRVSLPQLKFSNKTTAKITAYGHDNGYCNIRDWGSNGSNGAAVKVACYDISGAETQSRFTLLYATDENIYY